MQGVLSSNVSTGADRWPAQAPEAFWQTEILFLKKHGCQSTENTSIYRVIRNWLWDCPSLLHVPSPQQQGNEAANMQ